MSHQLTTLLFLCFVGATSALFCNCTVGLSEFCPDSGVCDADLAALTLKQRIAGIVTFMNLLREFPGDFLRQGMQQEMCKRFRQKENITSLDLLLLQFQEWEPACMRIHPGHPMHNHDHDHHHHLHHDTKMEEEQYICSLAPQNLTDHHRMLMKEMNSRTQEFWKFMDCPQPVDVPLLTGDVTACRHEDWCNTEELLLVSDLDLPDNTEAERQESKLFLYILVPCAIVLFLVIVGLTVLICWYTNLWKFVYRIEKEDEPVKDRLQPERLHLDV